MLRYTHIACLVEISLFTAYSELVLQLRAEVTLNGESSFVRNADDHPPAYTPNKTAEIMFIVVRTSNLIRGWNFNSGNYLFTTDTK